jgi:hypothetical protein
MYALKQSFPVAFPLKLRFFGLLLKHGFGFDVLRRIILRLVSFLPRSCLPHFTQNLFSSIFEVGDNRRTWSAKNMANLLQL